MDFKPVITCNKDCGANNIFRSLELQLVQHIPSETCEWKRTHHRPTKQIRLEARFKEFDEAVLENYRKGEWSILEHPILHIYVTECHDIDNYKKTCHEEIEKWIKLLHSYDVNDWMILLIETADVRKTKNLLRGTVLDKIRADFCTKNEDRCISVLYPSKQKSNESFRGLVQRIRFHMLTGYTRNISHYEELIHSRREKRNRDGWDFREYFFLQEDLAFVLEKLELPTEALIQYDELDALFSQFVNNTVFEEKHKWLEYFKRPLAFFQGICLRRKNRFEIRERIRSEGVSLLEYRNYLFERQANLLEQSNDVPAIAKRLLNFLFSTLHEVEIAKLDYPEGALICWQFVCALEVLQICEMTMDLQETQMQCFQYCAPIWNHAKDKLYELGKLCGLLPGCTPTSAQLHIVVQLSSGIGEYCGEKEECTRAVDEEKGDRSPGRKPRKFAPEQLKEALSSIQAFQKLYKELAELAISTYKHVSYLRSARLVGLDLGNFYCALNEPHKAIGFFTDLLRELKAEKWPTLYSQTLLELANCYRKMGDTLAYTKTCSIISCCLELEMLVRTYYFNEFLRSLKTLDSTLTAPGTNENANYCVLEDHFHIIDIEVLNDKPIIQDDFVYVHLQLESLYPREVVIDDLKLSFDSFAICLPSQTSVATTCMEYDYASPMPKFFLNLVTKEDKTLALASLSVATDNLKPLNPVRRSNSTKRKLSPSKMDCVNYISGANIVIQPGLNQIEISAKGTRVGQWEFKQLSLRMSMLEFLSEQLPPKISTFEITTKPASAALHFKTLIAGIIQPICLHISGGSFIFPSDANITLKCSKNLRIRLQNVKNLVENNYLTEEEKEMQEKGENDEVITLENAIDESLTFQSILQVPLENFKSFEEREVPLEVLTDIPARKMAKHLEHYISLTCPWSRNELQIPIPFQAAIETSCHLHTCSRRKYLQVNVKGLEVPLYLSEASVHCNVAGVSLIDLNPRQQNSIEICKSLIVSYLYEIQVEPLKAEEELPVIKVQFNLKYASIDRPKMLRNYNCSFDLADYVTLFKIHAQLEPNELCRVRSVCNLNLKITKEHENPYVDLMYEILTDQNLWAVCGRSVGVISMKDVNSHSISLDVMPLSTGFLPLPTVRLSKYIAGGKNKMDNPSKVQPFPPGQLYNSTKSIQIHVIAASAANESEK